MNNKQPFLLTIPAEEYHNDSKTGKYLSSHLLIDFMKSPAIYAGKLDGSIENDATDAMFKGTATHTLILEGKVAFDKAYIIDDGLINPKTGEPYGRNTKNYREWLAVQEKPVVSKNEFALMQNLFVSVKTHKEASRILAQGVAEKVVRFEIRGTRCQSRLDWVDLERGILADLKTCENIDKFARNAVDYSYFEQMAFYRMALAYHGTKPKAVYLIAVEKTNPYRCGVFLVAPSALDRAEQRIDAAVAELQMCKRINSWATRYETIRTLDLPKWIYETEDNSNDL